MSNTNSRSSKQIWRDLVLRTFWYGGSTFDAWLNIASVKVHGRLLTLPHSIAELGLPSAIVLQLLRVAMGLWSTCIISVLYLRHKSAVRKPSESRDTTQLHEVIGGLLGPRWGAVSLFFNIGTLFTIASVQLLTSANIAHTLNPDLDKRTWVLVFGAISSLSIFTPTAQNYRVWSCVGVVTTLCSSAYLTMAPPLQQKATGIKFSAPRTYTSYFSGMAGSIFIGHVLVPVEIMDAMSKPQDYPGVSLYGILYMLVLTMSPSMSIYLVFGDKLQEKTNSLPLLRPSTFRQAALLLMLIHQFIIFGIYSLGVYTTCEKLVRVHESSSYAKRTICRVPVFLAIWLAALAFPFFGIVNAVFDSTFVIWNLYIIPCAAYIVVFWFPASRRLHSATPFSRIGWSTDLSINLGIVLWAVIVDCGLGASISFYMVIQESGKARLFAKCYAC